MLLAYDLIKGYTRKGCVPKRMLQMDILKAYDTVDWQALKTILQEIGVPGKFVGWLLEMVTIVTYKFNTNGVCTKYMSSRRGFRQGDPISHLLFVILMEYLHRKLQELDQNPNFNYHGKCEKIKLIDVSFADDLLVFTIGDILSVN